MSIKKERANFRAKYLRYFQAQSEIDGTTSEHESYEVYHSREACQEAFPDSKIVEMFEDDVQDFRHIDIPTLTVASKAVAEAFLYHSSTGIDTADFLDANDNPIYETNYVLSLHVEGGLPSFKDVKSAYDELDGEDSVETIKELLELSKKQEGVFALVWREV